MTSFPRARRSLALAASLLLLGGLAAKALRPDAPASTSLSLARKHWGSGPTARLLNSPLFQRERELAFVLLQADKQIPLDRDAVLLVPPGTDPELAEARRRRAAFLLSPRRVTVVERPLPDGRGVGVGVAPGAAQSGSASANGDLGTRAGSKRTRA